MMAPDDDDISHSSGGDPLFVIEDETDDALPSLLEESPVMEKLKRMSGSGEELFSGPLVKFDISVLASPKKDESKQEAEEDHAATEPETLNRFAWVPGVFQRKLSSDKTKKHHHHETETDESSTEGSSHDGSDDVLKRDESKEEHEEEVTKPASIGLRGGGLMWIMAQQKRQMDDELEVTKVMEQEEDGSPRGPLGWLSPRKPNQDAAPVPTEAENGLGRRNWLPVFGQPRIQPPYGHEDESGSECDSSDDDSYDSDDTDSSSDYEEEEVVFDDSCRGALFTDGLVEQAGLLAV